MGIDTAAMSDEEIQKIALDRARNFRDEAPMTAAAAAKIILDGVKAERWRILVGDDAHDLDERVRQTPEQAYTPEFYQSFAERGRLAAGAEATASGVFLTSPDGRGEVAVRFNSRSRPSPEISSTAAPPPPPCRLSP